MLVGGVDSLTDMTERRHYRDAANLLAAVSFVFSADLEENISLLRRSYPFFFPFCSSATVRFATCWSTLNTTKTFYRSKSFPSGELRGGVLCPMKGCSFNFVAFLVNSRVDAIKRTLASQITMEFRAVFRKPEPDLGDTKASQVRAIAIFLETLMATLKSHLSPLCCARLTFFPCALLGSPTSQLMEACAVLDVLPPETKQSLIDWFVALQMRDYPSTFAATTDQVRLGRKHRGPSFCLASAPLSFVSLFHHRRRPGSTRLTAAMPGSSAWRPLTLNIAARFSPQRFVLCPTEKDLGCTFVRHVLQLFFFAFGAWQWNMVERLAEAFCKDTRDQLVRQITERKHEIDVKVSFTASVKDNSLT